ncbi:MAG: hypothetical protein JRJ65_05005 [Deltaproteobacteria bacterium]|nr:hypothetical protein [Deltaproteobacteria bacterium]
MAVFVLIRLAGWPVIRLSGITGHRVNRQTVGMAWTKAWIPAAARFVRAEPAT